MPRPHRLVLSALALTLAVGAAGCNAKPAPTTTDAKAALSTAVSDLVAKAGTPTVTEVSWDTGEGTLFLHGTMVKDKALTGYQVGGGQVTQEQPAATATNHFDSAVTDVTKLDVAAIDADARALNAEKCGSGPVGSHVVVTALPKGHVLVSVSCDAGKQARVTLDGQPWQPLPTDDAKASYARVLQTVSEWIGDVPEYTQLELQADKGVGKAFFRSTSDATFTNVVGGACGPRLEWGNSPTEPIMVDCYEAKKAAKGKVAAVKPEVLDAVFTASGRPSDDWHITLDPNRGVRYMVKVGSQETEYDVNGKKTR